MKRIDCSESHLKRNLQLSIRFSCWRSTPECEMVKSGIYSGGDVNLAKGFSCCREEQDRSGRGTDNPAQSGPPGAVESNRSGTFSHSVEQINWTRLAPSPRSVSGAAFGLLAVITVTGLLESLLFGVNPVDPITYGLVLAALVPAALLASWLPARRAAAVDPIEALRAE